MPWCGPSTCSGSESVTASNWLILHLTRRSTPKTFHETKVVVLLDALWTSVENCQRAGGTFPDSHTSEAYGQMIEGARMLLNETLDGLDAGSLYEELERLAELVCWDLDESKVAW